METFEEVVAQQEVIGQEIERIIRNYKKDPASRKDESYYMERAERLKDQWRTLDKNNSKLITTQEFEEKEHEYFKKKYHEGMTDLVNKYLEIFNEEIRKLKQQEATGAKKKQLEHGATNISPLNEELTKALRNQRALISVIDRTMKEVEDASQRSENMPQLLFYKLKQVLLESYYTKLKENNEIIWAVTALQTVEGYSWDVYFETEEKLQDILTQLKQHSDSVLNSPAPEQQPVQMSAQFPIKLPQITLPTFDGNPLKWVEFRDLFEQLIDEQPYKPIQKMFYLTTNLVGEPKGLIKHLPSSTENYNTAWEIIKGRYNNKRLLVTSLLNKLLTQPSLSVETSTGVKSLHDVTNECMLGLKAQGISVEYWDPIIVHLIIKKLDRATQTAFEQSLKDNRALVTLKELLQFLENRFHSLEAVGRSSTVKNGAVKTVGITNTLQQNSKEKCPVCNMNYHPLYTCKSFLQENAVKRFHIVQRLRLCINCLKSGHFAKDCTSRSCTKCSKKHNSLLHVEDSKPDKTIQASSKATNASSEQSNALSEVSNATSLASNYKTQNNSFVMLGTAQVIIRSNNGREIKCRAVLDSGSQVNLITERLINRLGDKPRDTSACIEGIGQRKQSTQQRTNLAFRSTVNGYNARVEAFVLPRIVSDQPNVQLNTSKWKIPENIQLADPNFNSPDKVDLLLGAEFAYQLLAIGQIKLGNDLPTLQNTLLGWIVVGKINNNNSFISPQTCGVCLEDEEHFEGMIQRFWQLDEPGISNQVLTPAEELCESHFRNNTRRNANGRFVVRLPFQQDPTNLGGSMQTAINRFYALERRLIKQDDVKLQYIQFMNEYEQLGHMEKIDINGVTSHYVIPHHCVIRPESSSTKLRVVFDASCKTSHGLSLNDVMFTGPTIQSDLFSILLRFRCPRFVFCTDIQKMYRQILIHPDDRKYQIIVWRDKPNDPLKFFQLNTVTYGTRAAPYLAIKCLQQLAKDGMERYPLGAQAVKDHFYVDDCLGGADSLATALETQKQLQDLLESAGFKLRKWCANTPLLLRDIAKEDQEIDLDFNSVETASVKTLGLTWHPKDDQFRIKIALSPTNRVTKRTMMANLAKIFDPLGILGPVLVTAKILIQDLWQLKLTWDEAVPAEVHTRWISFCDDLNSLQQFKIERHIFGQQIPVSIQLHAFCDASEKAYGVAIYLRAQLKDGRLINRLLCSRSRVAPLKRQTIPRLELCAALLGAEFMKKVKADLRYDVTTHYWSDSEIVLFWINSSPAKHQQFVANRIAGIQNLSSPNQWRHVSSKTNPADPLSRGIKPSQLNGHSLWFYGPMFLHGAEEKWPGEFKKALCIPPENPELKQPSKVALITTDCTSNWIYNLNHRNSFKVLQRIVGYVLRFIHNIRQPEKKSHTVTLSPQELDKSLKLVLKNIQEIELKDDLDDLKRNKVLKGTSSLAGLSPFLDEEGIIRVGGRLEGSLLPFNAKHQILLPYNDPIVKLLMKDIHEQNMHCGGQALLATTRQKFWPIKGKIMARSIVQHCVRCTRCKPKPFQQIMGNLPATRVQPSRPFLNTGVDFCGPLWVHFKVRGKRPHKSYLAVYCCFATKAVHLELVSDLTTEAFIGSLKRFIARRGLCQNLYCDNGTNFVGASNKLNELKEAIHAKSSQEKIRKACSDKGITFNFIPPRAPHFGGLWEAAVKSAKHLLVRSVATESLTYEELETVIVEIEAILNSRPITPMSSDPNDLEALTPGHFLIGEALTALADPNPTNEKASLLSRWKLVSHIKQEFWRRWTSEYLAELQLRNKWQRKGSDIKENTMVILKEDNVPPLQWSLGRIIKTYQGEDRMVRVVDVKTPIGTLKRPIHKLAPLFPEETIAMAGSQQTTVGDADNNVLSRKRMRMPQGISLATIIISLILLPIALCSPINVTQFQATPGIHFEEIGLAKIITSQWKIIVYYDLAPFKTELNTLKYSTSKLQEVCENITFNSTCRAITHYFMQVEEELRSELTFMTAKRTKRGAIDVVGNIANSLFGVLDSNYAKEMAATIKDLEGHDDQLKNLLKNQISVMDSTINVIRQDQLNSRHKFEDIENRLNTITKRLNAEEDTQHHISVINMLIMQISIVAANLQRIHSSIMDVLTDSHHEKINPLIITPKQLADEVEKIKAHLPSNLQLPVTQDNLLSLYKLMQIQGYTSNDHVIFTIKVPLAEHKNFELFHVTPVMSVNSTTLTSIRISTEYLAINYHRDEYFPMTEMELQSCTTTSDDSFLCSNVQSTHHRGSNICKCEISLFNNDTESHCESVRLKEKTVWSQLKNKNQWIYATTSPIRLNAVCGSTAFPLVLNGSGLMKIESDCTLKDNIIFIQGHQLFTSARKSAYTSIGITTPPEATHQPDGGSAFDYQPQLKNLATLQKLLEKENLFELSSKVQKVENHSLTVAYTALILLILLIIIILTSKLTRRHNQPKQLRLQSPQPLPRTRSSFDVTIT